VTEKVQGSGLRVQGSMVMGSANKVKGKRLKAKGIKAESCKLKAVSYWERDLFSHLPIFSPSHFLSFDL